MQQISVGVIYYDEVKKIEKCLMSIFSSQNVSFIQELIFVFNSSPNERVLKVLQRLERAFPIVNFKLLVNKNNNIGESRRLIVGHAKGKFLAFTDPDCEVSAAWLANFFHQLTEIQKNDERCVAICGLTQLKLKKQIRLQHLLTGQWLSLKSAQTWQVSRPRPIDHVQTSNCLFLVEGLKSVGSFSPAYRRSGEDLELGLRLSRNGLTQYICPLPIIVHSTSDSLFSWLRRCEKLGAGQWNPYLGERFLQRVLLLAFLVLLFTFIKPVTLIVIFVFVVCFFAYLIVRGEAHVLQAMLQLFLSVLFYGFGFIGGLFRRVFI